MDASISGPLGCNIISISLKSAALRAGALVLTNQDIPVSVPSHPRFTSRDILDAKSAVKAAATVRLGCSRMPIQRYRTALKLQSEAGRNLSWVHSENLKVHIKMNFALILKMGCGEF